MPSASKSPSALDALDGPARSPGGPPKRFERMLQQEASVIASSDDQALLNQVIGYYHEALKQSPEALAYLAKRGLDHPELVDTFRLGFANRTLGYRLPAMQTKAGAALRGARAAGGLHIAQHPARPLRHQRGPGRRTRRRVDDSHARFPFPPFNRRIRARLRRLVANVVF